MKLLIIGDGIGGLATAWQRSACCRPWTRPAFARAS